MTGIMPGTYRTAGSEGDRRNEKGGAPSPRGTFPEGLAQLSPYPDSSVQKGGYVSWAEKEGAPRSDCPLRPSPPNPLPRRWLALGAAGDRAEGVGQGIEKVQTNPVPPSLAPDFGERARPAELS